MHQIDLLRVDHCSAVEQLDDSQPVAPVGERYDGGPVDVEVKLAEPGCLPRRRGRPPRSASKAASSPPSTVSHWRMKSEEEDVCFVCFDGGSLVVCDRRGCPKAYHPACVKRSEAFFRSRAKWNCGWHICTTCQKDSFYMCFTCPYSACKKCVRTSDYVVIRGNKGLCGICMKTILMIENASQGDTQKVEVDFDDQSSWEYLFKIYWVSLKEKLSLSLDELTQARNPWKSASKVRPKNRLYDHGDSIISFSQNSGVDMKSNHAKLRKIGSMVSDCKNQEIPIDLCKETRNGFEVAWLYCDPYGETHGPFSMSNLRQWSQSGHFPPDLRIWKMGQKQDDSILLADALNGEVKDISNDSNLDIDVTKLEHRTFDVSPNSVSTDQSVISSSSSVITRNSVASNISSNSFAQSQAAAGSIPLLNTSKDQISCSLSLATSPGNWNPDANGVVRTTIITAAQDCNDLNFGAQKQSCLASFMDNQEIDFLDLFNSTFKPSLGSTSVEWQPIVGDLNDCDESVSDLLAEVEAMESQKGLLSSPTSAFGCPAEVTRDSMKLCLSPAKGLSPPLGVSKGDSMSSTGDLQRPSLSNIMNPFCG